MQQATTPCRMSDTFHQVSPSASSVTPRLTSLVQEGLNNCKNVRMQRTCQCGSGVPSIPSQLPASCFCCAHQLIEGPCLIFQLLHQPHSAKPMLKRIAALSAYKHSFQASPLPADVTPAARLCATHYCNMDTHIQHVHLSSRNLLHISTISDFGDG